MPIKTIPRLKGVSLDDRVKNKDGTVRRFRGERFVGDVVTAYVPTGMFYHNGNPKKNYQDRRVTEVIGENLVKVEGYDQAINVNSTWLIKKGA